MIILTAAMVNQMACEMCECRPWGNVVFLKNPAGNWYVDHWSVRNNETEESYIVYLDGRETEIIKWGKVL